MSLLYGPGYLATGDSAITAAIRILNQLVENLIAAGVEPVPGSVSDESIAADAAIAQSKIAGLLVALAALEAADDDVAAAAALAVANEAVARAADVDAAEAGAVAAIATEAAARTAADLTKLPLAGGTLTGPLVLPGNAASALQAVPRQQLDAGLAAKQDTIAPGTFVRYFPFDATGVAATDTANLQAALTAVPSGGTARPRPGSYSINAALTVTTPMTVDLSDVVITRTTDGGAALAVTSGGVTIRRGEVVGPQFAALADAERGIDFQGPSAAAPLDDVKVLGTKIRRWGGYGIRAKHCRKVTFTGNVIFNIHYAGVMGLSVIEGIISGNLVDNIVASIATNAYGIAVTRDQSDSLVTEPRSADIVIADNVVTNIPTWEGLDAHAGQRITFAGNIVRNCRTGIALGPSKNGSGVVAFAPLDCTISGNVLDSAKTDGTAEAGIVFQGAVVVAGSPIELATGTITGNTIRGYGDQSISSGGIRLTATRAVAVTGNVIIEPSPFGLYINFDNYDLNVSGNTVVDAWTNTVAVGEAVAFRLRNEYNTVLADGNIVAVASKNATYLLTTASGTAFRTAAGATVTLALGSNRSVATIPLTVGAGSIVTSTLSRVRVDSGVAQGSGVKHLRQTTGSVAAGATNSIVINYPASFDDENYTAIAMIEDQTGAPADAGLEVLRIFEKRTFRIQVTVRNNGAAARTGTVHVIAMRDSA